MKDSLHVKREDINDKYYLSTIDLNFYGQLFDYDDVNFETMAFIKGGDYLCQVRTRTIDEALAVHEKIKQKLIKGDIEGLGEEL